MYVFKELDSFTTFSISVVLSLLTCHRPSLRAVLVSSFHNIDWTKNWHSQNRLLKNLYENSTNKIEKYQRTLIFFSLFCEHCEMSAWKPSQILVLEKHIVCECMKYFKIYQHMLAGASRVFMIDKWDVSFTMT